MACASAVLACVRPKNLMDADFLKCLIKDRDDAKLIGVISTAPLLRSTIVSCFRTAHERAKYSSRSLDYVAALRSLNYSKTSTRLVPNRLPHSEIGGVQLVHVYEHYANQHQVQIIENMRTTMKYHRSSLKPLTLTFGLARLVIQNNIVICCAVHN